MNERTEALAKQAAEYAIEFATQDQELYIPKLMEKFAELIVRECARLARNTNLEDVEGGDSSVLLAAKHHILDHFGVEE